MQIIHGLAKVNGKLAQFYQMVTPGQSVMRKHSGIVPWAECVTCLVAEYYPGIVVYRWCMRILLLCTGGI